MRETDTDRALMARALSLAELGAATTTPNPRVGCVIARDGRIIGEGWHRRPGAAHAEADAIADARRRGEDPRGATLYVNLEPCNHTGRTGPCSEAIIAAGIARVHAAVRDPHTIAAGGFERLAQAGIAVQAGLLADEAAQLNAGFLSRMTRGRPWVRTKLAASLDGRSALANGASQWITGPQARADGHAWRARACAILTGVGTVLQDDPQLTVRAVETTRQPLRVIVDRHGDTPPGARVFGAGGALVVTAGERNAAWPTGVESVALPDGSGRVDLAAMMRMLAERELNEVHVEAGAKLNGALLAAGLIDEILLYVAPTVLGEPARGLFERATGLASLDERTPLAFDSVERIGDDLRIVAHVVRERG